MWSVYDHTPSCDLFMTIPPSCDLFMTTPPSCDLFWSCLYLVHIYSTQWLHSSERGTGFPSKSVQSNSTTPDPNFKWLGIRRRSRNVFREAGDTKRGEGSVCRPPEHCYCHYRGGWYDTRSCFAIVLSCDAFDVMWCHVMSFDVMWCHGCHVMPFDVIWCHVMSLIAMSAFQHTNQGHPISTQSMYYVHSYIHVYWWGLVLGETGPTSGWMWNI